MVLENIDRETIIQAIKKINSEGVPPKNKSTDYNLIYEGNLYPPKYVVQLANNNFTNNEKLDPNFNSVQAVKFLRNIGFEIEEIISFPKNIPIEELANKLKEIEDGKEYNKYPINIPSECDCNVIPAPETGDCKEKLIAFIIDKKDFRKRMPAILMHHINCKRKHKKVTIVASYWDGIAWETIWEKHFKNCGVKLYLQMYDGEPQKII